ncbi:MAG: hypothetical protein ATN36_06500 [Epulopiscium sp. Nele67-Bin005]|nr:MAG: hypothetical protein ATN36_06500 [Epulopiscium sp. Nele67-Bin005]
MEASIIILIIIITIVGVLRKPIQASSYNFKLFLASIIMLFVGEAISQVSLIGNLITNLATIAIIINLLLFIYHAVFKVFPKGLNGAIFFSLITLIALDGTTGLDLGPLTTNIISFGSLILSFVCLGLVCFKGFQMIFGEEKNPITLLLEKK